MSARPRRRPLAALALAAALAAARADAGVRLDLVRGDGAASCSDGADVQREVARRLADDPFTGAPDRFIEVVLARDGAGPWTARVRVRDAAGASLGARDLASDDATCGPLSEVVALTVALLVDPEAHASPPPPPAPVCPPPPPPRVVVRRVREAALAASAHAVVDTTVVPGTGLGAALRGEVALGRAWRIRLGATWFPAANAERGGARFAVGATTARAGLCRNLADAGSLALDACADLNVGALHASVDGAVARRTGDFAWASAQLGARLRWRPLAALVIDADAAAVVPFVRRAFGVAGAADPVFESPAVGLAAALGVGVVLR
jgi:hypothetical protein